MSEKTFLVDTRLQDEKFCEQVQLVVQEILEGNVLRIHCPNAEYAERFGKAIESEIKKYEEFYEEITKPL